MCYWLFIAVQSQIGLGNDASGYLTVAQELQKGGLPQYLSNVEREPLFPLWISYSLSFAKTFALDPLVVQKYTQILVLLLCQIMLWRALKHLNINPYIRNIILLYWAISPAVMNAGLSLYSEILTFPLILLLWFALKPILSPSVSSWRGLKVIGAAVGLGLIFLGLIMVKALFEFIGLFMVAVLGTIAVIQWQQNPAKNVRVLVMLVLAVMIFETGLLAYKGLNLKYNGSFTMTDRGSWALYGNTMRRLEPLTPQRISAAIAFVPGKGFCRKFFTEKACYDWTAHPSDVLGMLAMGKLHSEGHSTAEINAILLEQSITAVKNNPAQWGFFAFLEGMKMFFWESTQIGFVKYPAWLQGIYNKTLFKDILRLLVAVLTILSVGWLILQRCRGKLPEGIDTALLMIVAVTILHSPFFILTRYTFCLIPLYLICIAYVSDAWFKTANAKSR